MPIPEEWAWLNDLPKEWVTPADLRGPTSDPDTNLVIKMLEAQALGNEMVDLLGRFLSQYALFHLWFQREAKPSDIPDQELALVSLVPRRQTRNVYLAWNEFASAFERCGRMAGSANLEHEALRSALEGAILELSATRQRYVD